MRSVYLETTIVSYLASRPSRDSIVAAHQKVTRQWWNDRRGKFDLCVSEAVILEASAGDKNAVARRLSLLTDIRRIMISEAATELAEVLLRDAGLPAIAGLDALHIALAATGRAEILLTWNCRHIANAVFRPRIELACRAQGYVPPTICTPLELLEG